MSKSLNSRILDGPNTATEATKTRTVTPQQVAGALQVMFAVAEVVKEVGRIPDGHLYAMMMEKGMGLDAYKAMIDRIVGSGVVRREGHELVWVGAAETT